MENAKLIIWGTSDSPKRVAKGLEKFINYCFNVDNEAIVLSVIQKFIIELHNGDYDETLQKRFSNQAIPPEYSHDLFIYMLGWINEQIHNQIKKNVPAYISSSDYLFELRAQCRRRDRNKILSAISMLPEEKDTFEEINRRATYIRQIELIDGEYTDLLQPSQVYFPQISSRKDINTDEQRIVSDEDKIAVRKVFKAMSAFKQATDLDIQIIVTEHADEDVWGDIDGIHLVEKWRGGNQKLVPNEWVVNQ